MVRETRLDVSDLVYPVFVAEGAGIRQEIDDAGVVVTRPVGEAAQLRQAGFINTHDNDVVAVFIGGGVRRLEEEIVAVEVDTVQEIEMGEQAEHHTQRYSGCHAPQETPFSLRYL